MVVVMVVGLMGASQHICTAVVRPRAMAINLGLPLGMNDRPTIIRRCMIWWRPLSCDTSLCSKRGLRSLGGMGGWVVGGGVGGWGGGGRMSHGRAAATGSASHQRRFTSHGNHVPLTQLARVSAGSIKCGR